MFPFLCVVGIIRFEKNDILRIVRALAIFRPSLIALQMPLSVEDEVFVEKCFQRSLLVRIFEFISPLSFPLPHIRSLRIDSRNWRNSSASAEPQLLFGDALAKSAS